MKVEIYCLMIAALIFAFIASMVLISELEKTKREIFKCQTMLEIKKLEVSKVHH